MGILNFRKKPKKKIFARDGSNFEALAVGFGACLTTDRITVDGCRVGYMYREEPDNELDSGWRFFAGDESDTYANDSENSGIYDLNTLANYDQEILPFIEQPIGSSFIRRDGKLILDDGR